MNREKYIQMLAYHDWTFEYSDDHSMWIRGKDERAELNRLQPEFDPDFKLWNDHCPKGWERQCNP